MFTRLSKRLSLPVSGSKSTPRLDASSRPSTSRKSESTPSPSTAAVTTQAAEGPPQSLRDRGTAQLSTSEIPIPVPPPDTETHDEPHIREEQKEQAGKTDGAEDAAAERDPQTSTAPPSEQATIRGVDSSEGHADGSERHTPSASLQDPISTPDVDDQLGPRVLKRPKPGRTVSTNALDGHSPLRAQSPPPVLPIPAAPRKPETARKRASTSTNVFSRLLSVDWTMEKTTLSASFSPARAERQACYSAVRIRTFIVGPSALAASPPPQLSKSEVKKLRASLLKPEDAKRIVAHLRTLPSHPDHETLSTTAGKPTLPAAPIHAACLTVTDAEAESMHFSKLVAVSPLHSAQPSGSNATTPPAAKPKSGPGAAEAAKLAARLPVLSPSALESALRSMNLVSLVTAPDLGLGHPASDPGIFSGAVPSAQEIGGGVQEVGRTLIALGFAGSGMVWPDHTGVYPPTDRMSCYTYWWGYELVLPHKSVEYLSQCESVSSAMINFLTALALFTEGVREILPFVRYISQFVDMEFDAISQQDQGRGVVCAATWLIPVALVPRPWDFPPRPANLQAPPPVPKPILHPAPVGSPSALPQSPNIALPSQPDQTPASPDLVQAPQESPISPISFASAATTTHAHNASPPVAINPVAAGLAISSLTLGSSAAAPSSAAVLAGFSPVPNPVH